MTDSQHTPAIEPTPAGQNTPIFQAPMAASAPVSAVVETTMSSNPDGAAPATSPTVTWGAEEITLLDERPMPLTMHDVGLKRRSVVVELGRSPRIAITEEAAYTLTYAATPNSWSVVRETAKHDMLTPRRPSAMRIYEIEADLMLPQLAVGPQPRTETDPNIVAAPRVRGGLDENGKPIADYQMTFRDQEHLEDWTREVIKSTDKQGGDYQTSIIEKGVSEPITVVFGTITLEDAGDGAPSSFTVPVIIDGITRAVRSWQVRLGFEARDIDQVADAIISSTIRPAEPGRANRTHHERVLETRNAATDAWRADWTTSHIQGAGRKEVEAGLRTAQALTLRGRLVVGCTTATTCHLEVEDRFPDAASELVRFTQENKAWRPEASAANAMHGVVRSLKGTGDITDTAMADFLLGTFPVDDLVPMTAQALKCSQNFTVSQAALYRAAFVLRFFTRPGTFKRSKADLRTSLNAGQIRDARYAHILSPLVEAPWRLHKASSLAQARNAYKRNGALTKPVREAWDIVVDTPMNLYAKAVAGDGDARITLMTAGGAALIADRFLTTEVVAGVGSGGQYEAPWRAGSISEVIELLGHEKNHRGLLQLALAMQEFQVDKEAANGLPPLERQRRSTTEPSHFYLLHAAADDLLATQTDGVHREKGSEVELTTQLLLLIADYDGTRRKPTGSDGGGKGGTPSPRKTLQDIVDSFISQMRSLDESGTTLTTKGGQDTTVFYVDEASQLEMGKTHRKLGAVIDWIGDRALTEQPVWVPEPDENDEFTEDVEQDAEEWGA
ncbi:hypothetical protein [Promicromonospora sp. NPDC057488]|uniref:hypothetical protein n=1 Tax=Promicromonospora sp. NPDC057488 TaxID=3346147 RepID=UPI00366DC130